jgi:hypothetical protein
MKRSIKLTFAVLLFIWIMHMPVFTQSATVTKEGELTGCYYHEIFIRGSYAYCAAGDSGLEIIDVSNPAALKKTGSVVFPDAASVAVSGNYAYAAAHKGGLKVIDISDPSSPAIVGFYDTGNPANIVTVEGHYAYVGTYYRDIYNPNYGEILIIDISTPSKLVLTGRHRVSRNDITGIQFTGNYAYVINYTRDLSFGYTYDIMEVVDISDHSNPIRVWSTGDLYLARAIYISGNYLYTAEESSGVDIWDISNPVNPVRVAWRDGFPWNVITLGVQVKGNFAYVANSDKGVWVMDVSDPLEYYTVGTYTSINSSSVFATGDYVYSADKDTGVFAVFSVTFPPGIILSKKEFTFSASVTGAVSSQQTLGIKNSGDSPLNWTVSTDQDWLSCSPASGTDSGVVSVSANPAGLVSGTYTGKVTVTADGASNSPKSAEVTLIVYDSQSLSAPFGEFATPLDGSTVSSSIAVTGWALDDIGVDNIKIYREEGQGLVYIGDAVQVEGARPDVQAAFPGYPDNHKAGWGYMLLTNFLPGEGNGTYKLHALATDKEGNLATLGTKTITCDNAHAVKPFGAIDTPKQGGLASGNQFVNFGWALTPQPAKIPIDGSTIDVWVDGVKLGHPVYNNYREDIADLFPGYANSGGAVGYFYLDTTMYTDGVHTIQWSVSDDAGHTDGIGSRYFTIQNSGSRLASTTEMDSTIEKTGPLLTMDTYSPVRVKKGYREDAPFETFYPAENGIIYIEVKELERLEIQFTAPYRTQNPGTFQPSNHPTIQPSNHRTLNLTPLPVGAALNRETGTFTWGIGPGFLGAHRLEFRIKHPQGGWYKRVLIINIKS